MEFRLRYVKVCHVDPDKEIISIRYSLHYELNSVFSHFLIWQLTCHLNPLRPVNLMKLAGGGRGGLHLKAISCL